MLTGVILFLLNEPFVNGEAARALTTLTVIFGFS
jgi:hypothetical protein